MTALRRVPVAVLSGLVRAYRLLLQPWIGNVCRYQPTCSAYALQALQQHGALRGVALGSARILRCNPWCSGGHDPVPDNFGVAARGMFTRFCAVAVSSGPAAAPSATPNPHPTPAPPTAGAPTQKPP